MRFKTIENKKLFLEISSEMGASIISFKEKSKNLDIFRSFPANKKISKFNSYFTGYFATVPYFGAVHENTFPLKNNYISLMKNHILEPVTIHGEGWINKWDVSKQTKNSIELVFKHNGKKNYPYAYKAKQTFKLKNKSLIISISLENIDKDFFYCGIGFHPWFNLSEFSKIHSNSFTYLKKIQKEKLIKSKMLKSNALDLNKYKIDETFLDWNGKSKLIINKNLSLIIKNKNNVNNLHVFSPPKKNFFCIEPVTNIRDAFYTKKLGKHYHGLKKLNPNKIFKAEIEFEVIG